MRRPFHSSLYSLLCLTEVKIEDNFIESPNLEPTGEFDLDGCAYDIKTEPWKLVNTHETCYRLKNRPQGETKTHISDEYSVLSILTFILNVLNLSIESAKMKSRVKPSYQNREL